MKTSSLKTNTLADVLSVIVVLVLIGFFASGFVTLEENEMVRVDGTTLTTSIIETEQELIIQVNSFLIDKDLVTVGEFEKFVEATGYITEAEKFGDAGVFEDGAWTMVSGATFRYPFGPEKPPARPDHPVTQVSWNDARAYAVWKGKRLPTQWEWELAAKNGNNTDEIYSWGATLVIDGKYKANTWQGSFPNTNTKDDGYEFTSPVGVFGRNRIGLSDMGGNVWQWCADEHVPTESEAEIDVDSRKILRGGSYLCDPMVCHGYQVTGRSSSTPESSMSHIGFRCAKDIH
jgi:formylglycine-generating enzyme